MTPTRCVTSRKVPAPPSGGAASGTNHWCDIEVPGVTVKLLCAACHGDEEVRSQDEFGDLGFCDDCLDRARAWLPEAELGGEC